jgi:type IV pilus assembly protein PilA
MLKLCYIHVQRSKIAGDRRGQKGFTLIEVLVVAVILGILGTFALPSFLNQPAKAKQAGVIKYLGSVNRAQQAFYTEHNRFASSPEELGFNSIQPPANYTITITPSSPGVNATIIQAEPTNPTLRGYAAVVLATEHLLTHLCRGDLGSAPTPTPVAVAGVVELTHCDDL